MLGHLETSHPPTFGRAMAMAPEVHPPERLDAAQPGVGTLRQLRHGSEASDEIRLVTQPGHLGMRRTWSLK